MPVKPNGALCAIKEQIVEDLASGLILQFECSNGHTRLVIAGRCRSATARSFSTATAARRRPVPWSASSAARRGLKGYRD